MNNLEDEGFKIVNDFGNTLNGGGYESLDGRGSGCGRLDLDSGQRNDQVSSLLVGFLLSLFILVGKRQFESIL